MPMRSLTTPSGMSGRQRVLVVARRSSARSAISVACRFPLVVGSPVRRTYMYNVWWNKSAQYLQENADIVRFLNIITIIIIVITKYIIIEKYLKIIDNNHF